MRELSWHPSSPLTPHDAFKVGRADTQPVATYGNPSLLLLLSRPHAFAGCGHGGTRKSSISRTLQTWSVNPAAMAGVCGCQRFANPGPCVGSGSTKGIRKLACGRQKL